MTAAEKIQRGVIVVLIAAALVHSAATVWCGMDIVANGVARRSDLDAFLQRIREDGGVDVRGKGSIEQWRAMYPVHRDEQLKQRGWTLIGLGASMCAISAIVIFVMWTGLEGKKRA